MDTTTSAIVALSVVNLDVCLLIIYKYQVYCYVNSVLYTYIYTNRYISIHTLIIYTDTLYARNIYIYIYIYIYMYIYIYIYIQM